MSLFRSRFARVLIGLSGVALLGAAAPAAQAATSEREAWCSVPLVGPQRVTLALESELPSTVGLGSSQPSTSATVTLDWGSIRTSWWKTIAAGVTGTAKVPTTPHSLKLPTSPVDFSSRTQTFEGTFPGYAAPTTAGAVQWKFAPSGFELVLRLTDSQGRPVEFADEEYAPDTDDDPSTVNVRCSLAPNSDVVFHTTQVSDCPAGSSSCGLVTVERQLNCALPLVGFAPATLTIQVGLPSTAPPGGKLEGNVDWTLRLGGQSYDGFRTIGAKQFRLGQNPRLTFALAVEGASPTNAVATGASTLTDLPEVDPGPTIGIPLSVDGALAPVTLPATPGRARLSLPATVNFNLLAYDAEGKLIEVPEDSTGEIPVEVEPGTGIPFKCQLATGADPVIHSLEVVPPPVAVAPTNLTASPRDTSAELTWSSAEPSVKHHDVVCGNTEHFLVTEPKATVTGLTPGQRYTCEVRTVNTAGQTSAPAVVTFSTVIIDYDTPYAFGSVTGSAALKSLVTGTLPLTGSLNFSVGFGGNTIKSGALKLNPTKANLRALGFVPVTAKVEFANVSGLTGTLSQGKLAAEQAVRVKLPEIRVFGVVIGGGSNCQTRSASTIKLLSDTPVTQTGGSLLGSFAMSNLSGCGALNGLVSPLTSSTGNTIRLVLKP